MYNGCVEITPALLRHYIICIMSNEKRHSKRATILLVSNSTNISLEILPVVLLALTSSDLHNMPKRIRKKSHIHAMMNGYLYQWMTSVSIEYRVRTGTLEFPEYSFENRSAERSLLLLRSPSFCKDHRLIYSWNSNEWKQK